MKLVLLKDVKGIGKAGDMKNVSDGYAQNFLIPNKLAQKATSGNVKRAEESAKKAQEQAEKRLKEVQKIVADVDKKSFVIKARTQESSEKLFGSIDKKQIIEELEKENIKVGEATIGLKKPIKYLGEYPVKIGFAKGISATIKIVVEKE